MTWNNLPQSSNQHDVHVPSQSHWLMLACVAVALPCAGGLWQKAEALFDKMKAQGCRPDVVTYSSLLAAYRHGDQWRAVVKTFDQMLALGCKPDSHVYLNVVDLLWSTGVAWAQARALQVYGVAARQWPYRFTVQQSTPDEATLELTVPGSTPAVAAISLHKYLLGLRMELEGGGPAASALLGRQLVRVTLGRGRHGRDTSSNSASSNSASSSNGSVPPHSVSEALQEQLAALGVPFR
jgi:pentatricopeptide repeat domain-containing protein 1